MRFSISTILSAVVAASSVQAVYIPPQDAELVEKRQIGAIVTTLISAAGTAAASKAGEAAVTAVGDLIKDISSFDDAREAFTKQTVENMFANNPDPARFVAAICYNKDYDVKDRAGISEIVSAKVSSGLLNTDYDCMYMGKANQFYTFGDGGFINFAFKSTTDCTLDNETKDITCA